MLQRRELGPLFAPRSVAVVGASRDPAKWGGLLARGALRGSHRRAVHLVNRHGGEILGAPAYPTLADLPEAPELVVACVPPESFAETVDEALAAGGRAIVGITAGVGEPGERAAAARVRDAGGVLLGPNCLGVFDRDAELELAPWIDFPPGEIGLIAQSGNLALELGLLAEREGLGFSRFASIGNQADLEAADLLADFARHDGTKLIALYVEDFRDGRAFAQAAHAAGKPVVLLAAGTSDAGRRAARSHTGALVSDLAAVDAACRAAGIVRVSTPRELIHAAHALARGTPLRGRRVAVLGDGGGHGVVAADVATRAGLELPELSNGLAKRLAAALPPTAATANPVDLAGGGERDVASFERAAGLLLDSGEVDALLLTGYFGGYETAAELEVARSLGRLAAAGGTQLAVHTLYPASPAADALRDGGALVYGDVESAAAALAVLAGRGRVDAIAPLPEATVPPAAESGYFASRALIQAAGIATVEAREVRTLAEAETAAAELGYPVVLKALGRDHKSAGGGVVAGLAGPGELVRAYRAAERGLRPEWWSVERNAPVGEGIELLVGTRRDPRFGPLLVVAAGGTRAELVHDVAVALAPVGAGEARALIRSLRCAPLLERPHGGRPLDVDSAAEAAAALSRLAAAAPWIGELEVNPLLVTPDGATALDAHLVLASSEPRITMEWEP